jgi:cellobiose-specific phosphotransferase system component IIC
MGHIPVVVPSATAKPEATEAATEPIMAAAIITAGAVMATAASAREATARGMVAAITVAGNHAGRFARVRKKIKIKMKTKIGKRIKSRMRIKIKTGSRAARPTAGGRESSSYSCSCS